MKKILFILIYGCPFFCKAQLNWHLVDSVNANLPKSVQLFYTIDSLDGKPNKAYYIKAKLNDKNLVFDVDTTTKRRLTPAQFFEKNNKPLVVVNGTFFSFESNQNLNVVIKNKEVVAQNINAIAGKGKDTLTYKHPFRSAIGITKKRKANIAFIYTDKEQKKAFASQQKIAFIKDSISYINLESIKKEKLSSSFKKWNVKTAIGGGPILLQNGNVDISNEEELLFAGKNGRSDKHPRTAMGYTQDGYLIILVVEGRYPGIAEGASLLQEATILKSLGCFEALNLDGGGSSCMLINGKETIKPSDKGMQRSVPAVFIIKQQ